MAKNQLVCSFCCINVLSKQLTGIRRTDRQTAYGNPRAHVPSFNAARHCLGGSTRFRRPMGFVFVSESILYVRRYAYILPGLATRLQAHQPFTCTEPIIVVMHNASYPYVYQAEAQFFFYRASSLIVSPFACTQSYRSLLIIFTLHKGSLQEKLRHTCSGLGGVCDQSRQLCGPLR